MAISAAAFAISELRISPYFDSPMKAAEENTAKLLCTNLKIYSRLLLFSSFVFYSFIAQSQTTNISGVINSYYPVVEIIPAKGAIRVANITGLNMGDKILIIQMKGASVNTANNSSFGDTTSLNNAGNYETGTICNTNGDTAFLFFNLVNQYTVSEKVQLVKFAEYYSANVIDTVKAANWDNTSGTGAVIAISVTEDLTLNAPVYADSKGYIGGASILSSGGFCLPASAYTYNPGSTNPQNGAAKGEGIADIASNINGGRGAPANGGGGGNYHNNGGGGGANLAAGELLHLAQIRWGTAKWRRLVHGRMAARPRRPHQGAGRGGRLRRPGGDGVKRRHLRAGRRGHRRGLRGAQGDDHGADHRQRAALGRGVVEDAGDLAAACLDAGDRQRRRVHRGDAGGVAGVSRRAS